MGRPLTTTTAEAAPLCILLVEDDDACAEFVIDAFGESPERVCVTRVVRLQEALQQLATIPVDVVLLDLTLPDAFDLLGVNAIRSAAPDLALVVLTGSLDAALCARVIAAGADDYLQKDQVDAGLLTRSLWYARDRRACLDVAGVSAPAKPPRADSPADGAAGHVDGSLDIDAMMAAVAAVALPKFAAWCVIQVRDDDDGVIHHAHVGGPATNAVPDEDIAAVMRQVGRTTLIVPLLVHGEARGTLQLGRSEGAARYSEDDLELAVELARRAALTFESARLYRMAQATIEHRNEFLSITAQQLRKPLSKLQIQIDRMQRTVQRTLSSMRPAAQASARLTRFVTTLDSVAAGKLVIEARDMDLAQLAHEVVHRHRTESKASRSVGLVLHGDAGATGSWDRLLIEQVMTSLLDHAHKYGSGKTIELSIRTDLDVATLSVCHHGDGIAGQNLDRIFDRFELHVTRQIVEAHAGTMDVASEPGKGSSITVRLPRQPASATMLAHPSSSIAPSDSH